MAKLYNSHLLMSKLKIIHCEKCGRTSPGFEDLNSLNFIDNELKEFIGNFEVLNGTGDSTITLDLLNFKNSNLYKSTETSCEGVCTDCSPYYEVENGIVVSNSIQINSSSINGDDIENDFTMLSDIEMNSDTEEMTATQPAVSNEESTPSETQNVSPTDAAAYRSNDNEITDDEEDYFLDEWPTDDSMPESIDLEEDNTNEINYINVNTWGPENLMSLDIFDDDHVKNFYATLTRMEKMICSPLHLVITIIRCKKNDIPSSKNGSICFPLKRPLITEELPFTNVDKLPFVAVTYSKLDKIHQARVNFDNIRRVKCIMERKRICPVYGTERTYYRMNEELPFTNNAMQKLEQELQNLKLDDDGYVEIKNIRKVTDSNLEKRIAKEIKLDELSNWLSSDYKFAEVIKSFMACQREESEQHIEYTVNELWEEMMEDFKSDKRKFEDEEYNLNHVLTFFIGKRWLNINGNENEYNELLNQIAEELEVLSTEYTNDEGGATVSQGDTTVIVSEDPEEIMRQGLKGTFLNKLHFPGPNRDNPAQEFSPNYFALAFPFIFRSGDACPFQPKPIDIKKLDNWKIKYLDWMAMQSDVIGNEELVFCIYNIKRRLQSWTNSHIIMSQVKASEKTLTRQEIENDPCLWRWCASNLLRLRSNIVDSAPYWRQKKHEILGIKQHLESKEHWDQDKQFPIIPHIFSTTSVNYNHCPVIHRIISNKFRNSTSDNGNADWMRERLANVLDYPWVISWVGAFMAELDARYYSKDLQQYDYFISRQEYGTVSFNPHQHRISWSKHHSERIYQAENEIKNIVQNINEDGLYDFENDFDRECATQRILKIWEDARTEYAEEISVHYTNWNSCRTKDGERTTPKLEYTRNDIARLNMSSIINEALESGNFKKIDSIYNTIIETSCRHLCHTGPPDKYGVPTVSPKDGCCVMKRVLDREAMRANSEKTGKPSKKIYKNIPTCKRRKPQPKFKKTTLHKDPHKKQISLVSTACNDGLFNGCSPFRILFHLSNCDDKALVPSCFARAPRINFMKNDVGELKMDVVLYSSDNNSGEYSIKYSVKGPVGKKLPAEILMAAAEDLHPSQNIFNIGTIVKAYNQYALDNLVSIFNATYVNLNLPLILKNVSSTGYNVSGVNTLRSDYDANVDNENYAKNNFKLFDARHDNLDSMTAKKNFDVKRPMSMNEFFDTYTVFEVKEGQTRKLCLRKRRRETTRGKILYKAVHMLPFTTMKDMNPKSKHYWQTCQNILFWRHEFNKISTEIPQFATEEEKWAHWIEMFNQIFPEGDGLPTYLKQFYRHYNPKESEHFSDEEESEVSDIEQKHDEKNSETSAEKDKQDDTLNGIKMKNINTNFYQSNIDKMKSHVNGAGHLDNQGGGEEDDLQAQCNPIGHDFMEAWLGDEVVNEDRIKSICARIPNVKGTYEQMYNVSTLNKRQLLFHNIINDYIETRIAYEKRIAGVKEPEPLRLFLTGLPGTGKSHAMKTVMCTLLRKYCNDDWRRYIKTAGPTGAAVSVMKFEACTVHRLFKIKIAENNTELDNKRLNDFMQSFGKKVMLIIFDEFSMIQRRLFHFICCRLEQAKYRKIGKKINVGIVFAGDPAQILPIGDATIWSTRIFKSKTKNKRSQEYDKISLLALISFRDQFGLKPLSEIEGHEVWNKYCKDPHSPLITEEDRKKLSQYRQNVFRGTYKCVVLEEVKRKDDDNPLAVKYTTEILPQMRFGNVTSNHIKFIKKHMATETDMANDPEWKNRFILMGYHYYNPQCPERASVDSMNMRLLMNYHDTTREPVCRIEAIHTPGNKNEHLKTVPGKEFEGMPATWHFCKGSRAMLLGNINPALGLYNGVICEFVGPLYANKTIETTLKTENLNNYIKGNTFIKQLDGQGGNVIPKDSVVTNRIPLQIDGEDCTQITAETPQLPPALPDYMVVRVNEYAKMGGPRFFKEQHTEDYVVIPRQIKSRSSKSGHSLKDLMEKRYGFPLEGGDSESGFKVRVS